MTLVFYEPNYASFIQRIVQDWVKATENGRDVVVLEPKNANELQSGNITDSCGKIFIAHPELRRGIDM